MVKTNRTHSGWWVTKFYFSYYIHGSYEVHTVIMCGSGK